MPLDYETLRLIWWVLLGGLLIGFAIMDGFDLGIGILLPIITRTNFEKRIVINSIAATWEGNQVWFIVSGGAIFAAWPALYALAFSGFYFAMLLILLALILRPVGFKYRSKVENTVWRNVWDACLFIAGFVPTLVFGVAIGNVIQGVPFYFDQNLRAFYTGSFLSLLNPFALVCGLLSVMMLVMHGAVFLNLKTEGRLQMRAKLSARISGILTILLFCIAGFWIYYGIDGYSLSSVVAHDSPSNPLFKRVITANHAWFRNYQEIPETMIAPMVALVFAALTVLLLRFPLIAFFTSACSVLGIISTVGLSMFPFILPSSTHPNHSLLVWDSSSSELTLFIMLVATALLLPIVMLYTAWVYRVLRGKVTETSY